jgi:hypothetical protein
METKHTPRPWEVVKYAGNVTMIERHERTGYGYRQTNIASVLPVSEALDANARLIAAAPDMLGALRAIDARVNGIWDAPELLAVGPLGSAPEDVLRIAKAAIAKATGGAA